MCLQSLRSIKEAETIIPQCLEGFHCTQLIFVSINLPDISKGVSNDLLSKLRVYTVEAIQSKCLQASVSGS